MESDAFASAFAVPGMDLLAERSRLFYGSVKVWLSQLVYEDLLTNPRQLDPKNVNRLREIYRLEGCHRFDLGHRIPALIDRLTLDRALQKSSVTPSTLNSLEEPPLLDFEQGIVYLHGRHRLEAAKDFLEADDKWWVVDLFSEDLSEPGRRAIREEYSNASNYSDGDIFRHLRLCSLQKQPIGKWLARLSESKRRDLKQLDKLAGKDKEMERFRDSMDALIPYTGLWSALRIGTFHRLLPLRCPEELAHYLTRVKKTWDRILGCDRHLYPQLDSHTVEVLEGRCPCYSTEDLLFVEQRLSRREIFASPHFDAHRGQILQRVREIPHLIPTIHTFLEDTKYLEPCAKVMKVLLHGKITGSIRQAFDRLHNGQRTFFEQLDEAEGVERVLDSGFEARWRSYRQLWLFSWRHFPEMTGQSPRKDPQRPIPVKLSIEYSWWRAIADLASRCGYTDIPNPYLDADETMAREFLRRARPPQLYQFDDTAFDLNVRKICDTLKQVQRSSPVPPSPDLSSDRESCGPDVSFRCGRPFEQAFLDDVGRLFLRYVYKDSLCASRKRFITNFAVKRDIFHCFFGCFDTSSTHTDANLSTPKPTANALCIEDMPMPLIPSAGDLVVTAQRPVSQVASSDARVKGLTSLIHTTDSWSAVVDLVSQRRKGHLTFLTPVQLQDGQFRVQYLPISTIPNGNRHLITELGVASRGDHQYMDHDSRTGWKFVEERIIVENPYEVGSVIVRLPAPQADILKEMWNSIIPKAT